MSRLAARVATGLTLAAVVLSLLWLDGRFAPGRVALVVVTLLALAIAWELDRMGSFRGRLFGWPLTTTAIGLCLFEALGLLGQVTSPARLGLQYALSVLLAVPTTVVGPMVVRHGPGAQRETPWAAVGLSVWILPPLFSLVIVDQAFGATGLTVLVILAKIGDNAAYFVGRAIGKRHPFPNISPGKTVAGCVASLVAGIVTGAVILPLTLGEGNPLHAGLGALFGGLINVLAQAGDLSKSWVKRRAGVKDSSALLGPAGGVLDVIDSLLFAAPVALLVWSWAYPASGR